MEAKYFGYTFPLRDTVKREKVHFHNRYGISLTGDLYLPGAAEGKLAAVAVENFYAVGLRRDGRVCLGGRMVHRDLDQGRAEARNWENVCAIACSRSAIAALHPDGSVELAGNLPRCDKLLAAWNGFAKIARRELLAAARAEA